VFLARIPGRARGSAGRRSAGPGRLGHNECMRSGRLLVGCLATVGLFACSNGRSGALPDPTPVSTSTFATTTTLAPAREHVSMTTATVDALAVRVEAEALALASAAERARRGSAMTPPPYGSASPRPAGELVADCATLPAVTDVPEHAQEQCDDAVGWRTFAWIGESGDGIVRLERLREYGWVPVYHGPLCVNGVATATAAQLAQLGVPPSLAGAWGFPLSACQP
jgi:hypothetical protein